MNSDGSIYTSALAQEDSAPSDYYCNIIISCINSQFDYNYDLDFCLGLYGVLGAGDVTGRATGHGGFVGSHNAFFGYLYYPLQGILYQGQCTYFDDRYTTNPWYPPSDNHVYESFYPSQNNASGCAIGWGFTGNISSYSYPFIPPPQAAKYWDGGSVSTLSVNDTLIAINDCCLVTGTDPHWSVPHVLKLWKAVHPGPIPALTGRRLTSPPFSPII